AAPYPNGDTAGDTPSAMEINGKVLVVASDTPSDDIFGPGTYYEYDPATNSYATLPDPPAGRAGQAFTTRLMPLPGGQIMYTRGSDLAVYISEAGTGPKDEWRPAVTSVTPNIDGSYTLTGTQITGRSFGSNYGDDFFDSTNFPIVFLKDATDKVYFCKSYDFSTRAIWTGNTPVTCKFTPPAGLPAGSYSLFVSANGVASKSAVSFPPVAAPVLTGLTPATVGVGTTGTVLTLTGSAFAPTATVNFNGGAPVTPASITSTKITVAVPTSVLTTAGAYDVRVHNLGSPSDSEPQRFTVATPVITSLSPSVVAPGTTGVVLSISGSGYQRASKVSFNGATPVIPTYVTTTLIQVPVPDALLASNGSVAVTVVNTTAPGGISAPATLTIAGKPTLTSVTPASSGIGNTGLVLTLTGTGFTPQAKVTFNGATPTVPASVTPTQITVAVPAALISVVGSYALRVQNPGVSNTSTDNVVFKTLSPVISNIIPTAVSTTAGGTGLTINGANFIPGSTVTFGGVSATPISITTTKIVVPIPASAVQLSGQVPVVVVNTQGAGGSSNTVMLTVAARPTITALTPHLLALGGPNTTMTITGTSFQPGATVLFNDTTTVACTVKSTTEITVVAPASLATTNGTYFLRVVNVGAGNISNAAQYNVAPAQPVITSLSPDKVVVGLTSLNLYIYGTGFINGSKVTFNNGSPVDATYQSGRLIAPVPANLLATVGNVQVRVVNGADNGGTSVIANFTVAARAALTSVSPTTVGATDNPTTLTLNGSNFENGATVTINDTITVTPTSVTPTQITIILPTSVASTPGTYYARVINPGYANNSGIQKFTVVPAP
ncbi:MAG: IPT/TIG domain-containing protein, partial [Capsulimonas sp.]|uniref:IPT/TIG domain-containing protein n=1 Tax=Capsulimonas sp. TaxID=2494211 RepID=UPI0032634B0C